MSDQKSKSKKAWLGIFLVSLGAYFLLRNLGLIPSFIPWYLFGWEMVFILIGGSMLVSGKKEGAIFLAIGTFFILPDIFYWWPHFGIRDFWPIVLIIIGISIFRKRRDHGSIPKNENDEDFLESNVVFGSTEKTFTSKNFKGGKVTTIFGESKFDFSTTELSQQEVILDVFCMFGSNTYTVPNDWTVITDNTVVFGESADYRPKSTGELNDPNKILRIKGFVMFAGTEVRGA